MFLCWPSPWPPFSSKSSISTDEQIQLSAVLSPDVVSNKFDSSILKKSSKLTFEFHASQLMEYDLIPRRFALIGQPISVIALS